VKGAHAVNEDARSDEGIAERKERGIRRSRNTPSDRAEGGKSRSKPRHAIEAIKEIFPDSALSFECPYAEAQSAVWK
jgi:hypothetical protein